MTTAGPILSIGLGLLLALTHLLAGNLRFLDVIPRSRWLSFAGGVSVAYVFVHVLPELEERGEAIADLFVLNFIESHVYLVALLGFVAFYGLERFASRARGEGDESPPGVFWIHVGSFALYNALIGYLLLHRETSGVRSLVLFAVAMALHFVVNDYGLRDRHRERYERRGRWLLVAAVLSGLGLGIVAEVGERVVAVLFAFLAGGVVLNVIKEELPEHRESRFWAFTLGAAAYTAVLLIA